MKVFNIVLSLDDPFAGMDAISLVESPATEIEFLKFSKDSKPCKFKFDDEKREITGVVCLADTPIYRVNERYGEFYIKFTPEVIKTMMLKYSIEGKQNKVNIDHSEFVEGCYMIESYIKDDSRGVSPVEFKDVPNGSWFATFKVMNDELWEEIKVTEKFKGLSLEGYFDLEPTDEIEELLKKLVK